MGGLWVVAEGQGEMCGTMATTLMTLGYNPQKQRFVGTWMGWQQFMTANYYRSPVQPQG